MVFGADALAFLFRLGRAHAVAVLVSFLLRHQLAAVDALLGLVARLVLRLIAGGGLRACD